MGIKIGPANVEQHLQLVKIAKTSEFTKYFSNRIMFSTDQAYEKGWIRVAFDEDTEEPVGFYCVRQKVRGDKETMLYFITVKPEWRDKGVGEALLTDMKDNSPSRLIRLNVDKENRAVHFYERHGFNIISTEALGGDGFAMEWRGDDH